MSLPDSPADLPDPTDTSGEPADGARPEDVSAGHPADPSSPANDAATDQAPPLPPELGGQKGPEPTRYGDWEKGGRCTDF